MRDHSDTRARIQQVALELFTEQGYEATSLREIAERLGVTKAALYYHFKTKEDIVGSLVQDRIDALIKLIDWAAEQPRGPQLRLEFIQRYAAELHQNRHFEIMRFFERNQAALRDHPKLGQMRERMFEIVDILSAPDDSVVMRLKASMALLTLHATWFLPTGPTVTDEQRAHAALQVARELIQPGAPGETGGAPIDTPGAAPGCAAGGAASARAAGGAPAGATR